MKLNRRIITSLILTMILLLSVGCSEDPVEVAEIVYEDEAVEEVVEEVVPSEDLPQVRVELENGGVMVFELYPHYAPETVTNFLGLVEDGFYDGLRFHRIISGFMCQSGDPLGNGTGGSETTIKGEFTSNGFEQNTLKHSKGVLSMARSMDMDSASSQFFIMDGDSPNLDGAYAGFGKLIEGEDVLDGIMDTEVELSDRGELSSPTTEVIIKTMTIVE